MSTDGNFIDEIIFVMFVTTVFMLNYCLQFDNFSFSFIFFVIFMLFLGAFSAFPDKQRTRKE